MPARKHYRQRRRKYRKPEHTIARILTWADAWRKSHADWPIDLSGRIPGTDENWLAVDRALRVGVRGLPGGSSLAQLLAKRRGVRNVQALPPYTIKQILAWADVHQARTGDWPTAATGAIPEAPGETWGAVRAALQVGHRGLPGGTTLTQLLAQHRGARHFLHPPPLTPRQILAWADAHHAQTGQWPHGRLGVVAAAPAERWSTLDWLLKMGQRGLPGGSSLAQLLLAKRGVRSRTKAPPLTLAAIRNWAAAHAHRTGRWPRATDGAVTDAPGETWNAVANALRLGLRSLPPGGSLARLALTAASESVKSSKKIVRKRADDA